MEGQIPVAFTIINRFNHPHYPNTLDAVVNAKKKDGKYEYELQTKLFMHAQNLKSAKRGNTRALKNAIKAAKDALCGKESDPTTYAVNFCAKALVHL